MTTYGKDKIKSEANSAEINQSKLINKVKKERRNIKLVIIFCSKNIC